MSSDRLAEEKHATRPIIMQQLEDLVKAIKNIANDYKGSTHKKEMQALYEVAQEDLDRLKIEYQMLDKKNSAELNFKILAPKIRKTYESITETLQKQFDKGFNKWLEENKKIATPDMPMDSKYDLYNCLHLNADLNHHTSSRAIGGLLWDAYFTLSDPEKCQWMINIREQGNPVIQKTSEKAHEYKTNPVTQQDVKNLVESLKQLADDYKLQKKQKGFLSMNFHGGELSDLHKAALKIIEKSDHNDPTSDYKAVVNLLQNQFNKGLDKWMKKNKDNITIDMSKSTIYDMYNVLHLNPDPTQHTSSRYIGLLLKSTYDTLGNKEKARLMQNLGASQMENTHRLSR